MERGDVPRQLVETLAVFDEVQVPGEPLTTNEVAESADCSRRTAYDRLDRLADRGEIRTKKVGARGRVWWRPTGDPVSESSGQPESSGPSEPAVDLELYETVVETIWDGVYALDSDERFVMANEALLQMTGYDRQELLGEHASILHADPIGDTARERAAEAMRSDGAQLEHDLLTADGETVPVETRFGPFRHDGDRGGRTGVVRDVSDRKRRERAFAGSERRYRALVEHFPNGMVGLFDEDFQFLVADGQIFDEFDVSREDLEGNTIYDLFDEEVVDTLEPNFRQALAGDPSSFEIEYEGRTLQVRTRPVSDDDGDVSAGLVMTQDVTEQRERERMLERQRERLNVLNNLNAVIRQINEAIVSQSTREEIQQTVCESLAASDSYEFAWIAEIDPRTDTLTPRVEAGVDGYLELISVLEAPKEERPNGPASRAITTLEPQVVSDVFEDPTFEPWRDIAREYGYRSAAAIPIVHEGTLYGLVGVYADRGDAFTAEEREVVCRLGEMVGHAMAAVERKRALMSDDLIEVEFRVRDVFDALGVQSSSTAGTITLDSTVPTGDDAYIQYGTVEGDGDEMLRAFADALPRCDEVTLDDGFEETRFELRLTDPPVVSTVAGLGGHVEEARIESGDYHMAIRVPPTVDVRQIIESVQEAHPEAEMVTRRQVSRTKQSSASIGRALAESLTDRQVAALEASFYSGFFEWPRRRSGQEIAEKMDVAPATFHQHLREAERKVIEELFANRHRLTD
jgi:PAS domain S-box-containing protein